MIIALLVLAIVGYLFLTGGRRTRMFQDRPPAERAELERRVSFLRSGRGLGLFVAMFVGMLLWRPAVTLIWAVS